MRASIIIVLFCGVLVVRGAEIAGVILPSSAKGIVDFDRDVEPIFAKSCNRCHGPQRPKGHFRLDDRTAALKGGSEGADILPGNSARSPLIRYMAHGDDEIIMPPANNPKLTPAQIGILRAWIDQGAHWGVPNVAAPGTEVAIETTFGGMDVHGNQSKFRELEGTRPGLNGGVKNFSFEEQIKPGERFSADGHYLAADNDVKFNLALTKDDLGSIHAGFEQWRKYYENGGGYSPLANPPEFMANSTLFLNEGRAWVDFGLAPPNWPAISLGYEYQYRNGTEATLDWGTAQGVNIYPSTTHVDEGTHIIKLDVAGDWAGWHGEENARIEVHTLNNRDVEPNIFGAGPGPDTLVNTRTTDRSVQGMNTVLVERQFQDWARVSAGYYYSHLEANDTLSQTTTGADATPFFGNYWSSPQITLSTKSHIFSVASQFTPVEYLSLSLASQNEWTHEEGFGEADLSVGLPTTPALFNLFPVANDSNLDKFKAMQMATMRFSKIPWTVLFADLRFSQEQVGEFQSQLGNVPEAFAQKTDAANNLYDIRTGFTVSPWSWLSWDNQYHFSSSDSHYNHALDSTPFTGYPAFILGRNIQSDDFETKLILKPAWWLKTTLSYDIQTTDYSSQTDPVTGGISPGGTLTDGVYGTHNYGFNVMLTPWRPFYFSGAFTFSDTSTVTANNADPSIVPYRGHTITLTTSAGYPLSKTINLSATYSYSEANSSENNVVAGVPLGLDFTRHDLSFGVAKKFNNHISANLRYYFGSYNEPSAGKFNDFTAQGAFATIAYAWR